MEDSTKQQLNDLKKRCLCCTKCAIGGNAIGDAPCNVFSSMSFDAKIMVVGQNPGFQEVLRGVPFVGPSGKFFDTVMEKILGITRAQMYVTNTVKCIRHNCKVLLEDGTKRKISHLVREKYSGKVVSVNVATGEFENKKVIGWHKSPVGGRSTYKLSYKGSKRNIKGRVGPILTGDHPVLTKKGFKHVCELQAEDIIAIDVIN